MSKTPSKNLWKSEIEPRLQQSQIYDRFCKLGERDSFFSHLHSHAIDVISYSHQRSKTIVSIFPEYTLHDSDHLFRVLELADKLLVDNGGLEAMSIVDCYVVILAVFLHDVGLAPSRQEVNAWRKQVRNSYVPKDQQTQSISNFIRTYPKKLNLFNEYRANGQTEKALKLENDFIANFVRETHGERCAKIIQNDVPGSFMYRDVNLKAYMGKICRSHTEDARTINGFEPIVACGDGTYFSPRFCAVVLRLADLIDFDAKRAPTSLFEAIGLENAVSIQEWNKHRSVGAWVIRQDLIALTAECDHPLIQDGILEYCAQVNDELPKCNSILSAVSSKLYPEASYSEVKFVDEMDTDLIRPRLGPDGQEIYRFSKTRFTLDQDKVVDLLMGTSLYGNPAVALRELLQNSIDACLVRGAFEEKWGNSYSPEVEISFEEHDGRQFVLVRDNGMGMDDAVIENYYSKVGACFYSSPEFYFMLAEHDVTFTPISRFGIGVLSYFLVSNTIQVTTRRVLSKNDYSAAITVKVDGVNGIFWMEKADQRELGTTTKLELMEDHPWRKLNTEELVDAIKVIIPQPPFDVRISVGSYSDVYAAKHERVPHLETPVLEFPLANGRIRLEDVEFSSRDGGYRFSGKVGWLELKDVPAREFETLSKKVSIEGETGQYSIKNSLEMRPNRVTRWSSGFEVSGGKVLPVRSYRDILKSRLNLSLHGFHVPFEPFVSKDEVGLDGSENHLKPRCQLDLNLFLSGDLKVSSPKDLNLNAARDSVLPDEKWYALRDWLTKEVLAVSSQKLGLNERKELLSLLTQEVSEQWLIDIADSFY